MSSVYSDRFDEIRVALLKRGNASITTVAKRLNLPYGVVKYYDTKIKQSKNYKPTMSGAKWREVAEFAMANSDALAIKKYGLSKRSFRLKVLEGVIRSKPKRRIAVNSAEVDDKRVCYASLKKFLLEIGRSYACERCRNGGAWLGEVLVLQVHHVDGNPKNNRPHNLQFLCPNCHWITPTMCNRKRIDCEHP